LSGPANDRARLLAIVILTSVMSSPSIGDETASPSRANALSGVPSRDKMASASPRTEVRSTREAFMITLKLRDVTAVRLTEGAISK